MPQKILKALLLSSFLATSLITPTAASAENIYVMIVNARGDDGVYYPALRVVRGGTVFLFRVGETVDGSPLNIATLRNRDQLIAWLNTQFSNPDGETIDFIIMSLRSEPRVTEPEEDDCVETRTCQGARG